MSPTTHMQTIKFNDLDADILYSIPQVGVRLHNLICSCMITNRTGVPTFETLTSCLTKAVQTGIMTVIADGTFVMDDRWFRAIHQFDEKAEIYIDAMREFKEFLLSREWLCVSEANLSLSMDDYRRAVAGLM